ncbi:hypothetical protein [Fluviicola sp.]|uniref:hypothetical protein n=1 Tax=Fluviicola sp. TaxID=1917219 RepID=UPI003D2C1AE3
MNLTKILFSILLLSTIASCNEKIDGPEIEMQILEEKNLGKDFSKLHLLKEILTDINCINSSMLGKKIVLAEEFHSEDITEILLIPYRADGLSLTSYAYSDVSSRVILFNISSIYDFTLKNTLGDSSSIKPVMTLMLLHEIGHFMIGKNGLFDSLTPVNLNLGEQKSQLEPQYLSKAKKIELTADSLAISLVKDGVKSKNTSCIFSLMDVQRILPGMQFQLAGMRMIQNFGSAQSDFLPDFSSTHPNMELRISYMNYFLFPTPERKELIDNYIYNRTSGAVHLQELAPWINQDIEKNTL